MRAKNHYLNLAKKAVEAYIKTGKTISPPKSLPKNFFTTKAGAFVTLMKNKELRGCIGTYLPTKNNIAEEIIFNAVAAATKDGRFNPVNKEEFEQISYSVYILEKPEEIDNIKKLDPKKFGVLIKSSTGKSGLLLPDLDGISTIEEQLGAVCYKCGINLKDEEVVICRFKAEKHDEKK